ncbi:hypothetical protein [Pleionea sediminis]|uniref:hypothetical protein n=1 Tax=Pleionea sediminis TaxID=2569479 RepID=UPI001185BCEA|nr:hypothetical protein [Pleionea sediminis]
MSESRDDLLAKKRELEARVESIKKDFKQGLDADAEERAQQLENAEVLNALMEQAMKELQLINSKLNSKV